MAQSGHVRSAAGNENGDFGFLSHHYSRESGNPFPGLASGMGFRRSAIMCGAPRRAGAPAIGAAAHGAALFPCLDMADARGGFACNGQGLRDFRHVLFAQDRKSTRLELQSLMRLSYAVFCLKTNNNTAKRNTSD